jgi:hypothetical protein
MIVVGGCENGASESGAGVEKAVRHRTYLARPVILIFPTSYYCECDATEICPQRAEKVDCSSVLTAVETEDLVEEQIWQFGLMVDANLLVLLMGCEGRKSADLGSRADHLLEKGEANWWRRLVQTRIEENINMMKDAVMRHREHPLAGRMVNIWSKTVGFWSISERKRGGEHVKWSGVEF